MKNFRYVPSLSLSFLLITFSTLQADVSLPALFGDQMVLQQNKSVPMWGWADPGEDIHVIDQDKTLTTKADAQGKWKVSLAPRSSGGPYTITVKASNSITLSNVMFGEVWLCSGQSNMQWNMKNVNNSQDEIQNTNYPQIHLFHVERTTASTPGLAVMS